MTYKYTNLAINGMEQTTEQVFGKDGSWSMVTEHQVWNHRNDQKQEETGRFYYCYEDSQLVCYHDTDGKDLRRTVITDNYREEIEDSKDCMVGLRALMPEYLEGLYVTHPTGNDAITVLAYWLPVEEVMADVTMLSAYVNNAFGLSGNTYPSEANAGILTILEIDTETCQPISLSYIFHELEPYVLSAGAQSGEAAFDMDFMTMWYTFDYDLPDSAPVPEGMLP